ncbi:MAG TPA: class I SAM-dependent methyltransferase [Candidatus Limnocylindria bacterium]|nr:class I SAM-dependent methyltransferase [Candidatus Limnocylindria bacterium]
MSAIVDRYETFARDYARYWGPVLEETARRLLDDVDAAVARAAGGPAGATRGSEEAPRILDLGSGTGVLALAAAERWPQARILAADPASAMLEVAREQARAAGVADSQKLSFVVGEAERLPLADASIDVVVSSFVLQLVPDRAAALGETLRVLRPGGRLAYVTWLDRDSRKPFRPREEFDEAVLELGVEEPEYDEDEPPAGDVPSLRSAVRELRGAGFRRVDAREEQLVYDWTLEAYLEYKLSYDERALMSLLTDEQRRRLEEQARNRLTGLTAEEFRWHAPVVFARGERPKA